MKPLRWLGSCLFAILIVPAAPAQHLPGTKALTLEGDLAAQMVAGIDKYLMRALADSPAQRQQYWKPDYSSPANFARSVQPNRDRLKKLIGAVDPRLPVQMELVATTAMPALVAETDRYRVHAVRWPVLDGVAGEGLLLEPKGKIVANVVALPDADWTPEMLVGLAPGVPKEGQFARRLAENGCRVLVPVLIDRQDTWSGNPQLGRVTNQPHREFIYRMAFEMGRHILGYEVQKVLAAVDWFSRDRDHAPIGVLGYGEGGLLALLSSALDERIKVTGVCGYAGPREGLWEEPIYHNIWGYLREFGDAELLALIVPRWTVIEAYQYPESSGPIAVKGKSGAAPGKLVKPPFPQVFEEMKRAVALVADIKDRPLGRNRFQGALTLAGQPSPPGSWAVQPFLEFLQGLPEDSLKLATADPPADLRKQFDPTPRQQRQFDQLVEFTQKLLRGSEAVRDQFFWSKLRGLTPPPQPAEYEKSADPLRRYLSEEVIGQLPAPTAAANPRTRLLHDEPKWKGYEVVLDLYPGVFAYGILLVPNDLKPGEKRPVVVCQHGLEGRPQDVCNPKEKTRAYHSFGAQLADRGYIVFAPQNPYIGRDDFRVLQRKANPLQLSLFSFIVRQHERILDWLETLPFVDPARIAFYGLSYGGKTAMRVPALLRRYCLSICSGDFNEWIVKNVSVTFRGSYMFTGEYEMFEFDLGHTFNYAEMTALIAPRPFMVERGHDDGVGIDELVAYEYAKVRRLYSRLHLPTHTTIEFFPGGHIINAQGTFAFLQQHLQWPK